MNRLRWYALCIVAFFLLILLLGSCALNGGSTVGYEPTEDPVVLIDRIVQASNSWKDADGAQCDIILEYPGMIIFIAPKLGIYRVAYKYWNALEKTEEWGLTPWIGVTSDFRQYMDMRREEMEDPYDEKEESPWMSGKESIKL